MFCTTKYIHLLYLHYIYIIVCHEQLNIIKTVVPSTVAAGCLTNKLLFYFMICLLLIHNCSLWGGTFGRENFRKFSLLQSCDPKKLCCCNWETGKKYSGYKKYLLYYLKLKSNWNVILIFISDKNLNQPWRLGVCTCLRYECFWRDLLEKYIPSIQKFQIWRNHKSSEPIQTHFLRK